MLLGTINIIVTDVAGDNIARHDNFDRIGRVEPDNAMYKVRLNVIYTRDH